MKTKISKIMLAIFAMSILLSVPASADVEKVDFTEGGHLETDFGVNFMAEWWYLNGKATLVSSDGEIKDAGFFAVLAHQESPLFRGYSQLLTFHGLYFNKSEPVFNYVETFVPRDNVSQFISLHTPYVYYRYPDGLKQIKGSPLGGYNLEYASVQTNVDMDLLFQTNVKKTVYHANSPLNFTTYEHSYGTLHGSITINGKRYTVTRAEGYMDHMIPVSRGPWAMDMHGWNWFEVTTKNYQVVGYAMRGLDDGYENYSYKHLTLLDKQNGKVLAKYSTKDITISETGWVNESAFNRKRPETVVFSTPNLKVALNAESVIDFNKSSPSNLAGFVDFMAFQPKKASIKYKGDTEQGSAFFEYLVSDIGVVH
ncbi:MAG: hypothetical protein O8C66_00945 [Candidatus Methanoperedens sp.]|nr:hypothetical protein [Candidatus Methanoperedens sp.]MCZ7369055.1 hypothetical protein [Candidatus Methanoperedens sp.]